MSKERTTSQPARDGKNERGLTPRQERFVQEYLVSLNATDAAEKAGYADPNSQGSRLLVNVSIARAIRAAQDDVARRNGITVDMIVQEYKALAFSDLRNVMEWDSGGSDLVPSGALSQPAARAIQSYEQIPDEHGMKVKLKMHDKKSALDELAKRFWPAADRKEISGPGGGPIPFTQVEDLGKLSDEELDAYIVDLERRQRKAPKG